MAFWIPACITCFFSGVAVGFYLTVYALAYDIKRRREKGWKGFDLKR